MTEIPIFGQLFDCFSLLMNGSYLPPPPECSTKSYLHPVFKVLVQLFYQMDYGPIDEPLKHGWLDYFDTANRFCIGKSHGEAKYQRTLAALAWGSELGILYARYVGVYNNFFFSNREGTVDVDDLGIHLTFNWTHAIFFFSSSTRSNARVSWSLLLLTMLPGLPGRMYPTKTGTRVLFLETIRLTGTSSLLESSYKLCRRVRPTWK